MKEGAKYWTISEHFNASLKYVYYFMESLQKKKKELANYPKFLQIMIKLYNTSISVKE